MSRRTQACNGLTVQGEHWRASLSESHFNPTGMPGESGRGICAKAAADDHDTLARRALGGRRTDRAPVAPPTVRSAVANAEGKTRVIG